LRAPRGGHGKPVVHLLWFPHICCTRTSPGKTVPRPRGRRLGYGRPPLRPARRRSSLRRRQHRRLIQKDIEREVRRAAIFVARKPPPHQIHAASGPREAHRRGGAPQSPLAHPGDPRPCRLQLDGLAKVRQRLRQRDGCVLRDEPRANVAPLEKMEVRLSHRHLLSAAVQEEKGGVLAHERSPRTDLPEDATRRNAREEAPTQTADDHSRQGLEVQESRDNPILRLRS
jgi:hypothetical protein